MDEQRTDAAQETTEAGKGNEQQTTQQEAQPTTGAQETEGKTDGAGDTAGAGGEKKEPAGYEFTPPEGMEFDQAVVDGFVGIAQKHNLPPDVAREIADYGAGLFAAQRKNADETVDGWKADARKDAVLSDRFDEKIGVAVKAMKAYGDEELLTLLNVSGLGNHPAVIRAFYRAGTKLKEDDPVEEGQLRGGAKHDRAKDIAAALFENSLKGE